MCARACALNFVAFLALARLPCLLAFACVRCLCFPRPSPPFCFPRPSPPFTPVHVLDASAFCSMLALVGAHTLSFFCHVLAWLGFLGCLLVCMPCLFSSCRCHPPPRPISKRASHFFRRRFFLSSVGFEDLQGGEMRLQEPPDEGFEPQALSRHVLAHTPGKRSRGGDGGLARGGLGGGGDGCFASEN